MGDRGSLLIVRDIAFKRRATYTDFLRAEEGIATNILAARLAHLVAVGILRHDAGSGHYQLTPSGLDLLPALLELMAWGAAHDPHTAASPSYVARIHHDRERLLGELRGHLAPPPPGEHP